MRLTDDRRVFFVFTLIILNSLIGCQKTLPNVINDGYGDYVLVPAGEFLMGDNFDDSYKDEKGFSQEKPVHKVYLDAFYIGRYEITNKHQ